MLGNAKAVATVAVEDIKEAKKFYEGTLGLKPELEMDGWTQYECGDGTSLAVYPSHFAGTNEATSVTFGVEDVESEVKELKAKGVEFEDYDTPDLKTVEGIADGGEDGKIAWFRDPSGNILAIAQTGQ
ncbi:MAG: Glyoxalase/bleomycin resistance protein/dioxygenase [Candidatus Saccharibacteria bacterium]|jgi:catechol 2,3-dioxygenase-like lactoylglutathione lyase family enzyme|nr:Glyoxalase/bleomycin resistance protein/dioxygenase [Candidatus Saccharibacteria bacterium]